MPLRSLDYCELAERLVLNESNPAGLRTAISRAYYDAFLHASDFLGRMPIHLVGANPHLEVIALLSNAGDASVEDAARLLQELRDDRNAADYDRADVGIEDESLATQCIRDARDVIAKLNGCRVSATRFAAVSARARATARRLRGLPP